MFNGSSRISKLVTRGSSGLGGGRPVHARARRVERREAGPRDWRRSGYSAIGLAWDCATRAAGSSPSVRRRTREGADRHVRRAGLTDVVQVVSGDAFQEIPKLAGTFDFVFLDAWKKDYKRFFDSVYPRLDKGGLFLAHNVVNKRNEMGDFLDAVQKHPSLWTTIVSPSSEGISVSLKR